MATTGANVKRVTSTESVTDAKHIVGIKVITDGTGTVTMRDGSASGNIIWEETINQRKFEQVDIRAQQGVHLTIVATATVYLYLA